jgi:four helix bundle protein
MTQAGCVESHTPEYRRSYPAPSPKSAKGSRSMSTSFRELVAWQRAVALCTEIYRLTGSFPSAEQFGLANQLRRASVSIASNIAEGWGRSTRGEYYQFLGHARGSLCELQTQLVIAGALGYGPKELLDASELLSSDVSRLLIALMRKIKDEYGVDPHRHLVPSVPASQHSSISRVSLTPSSRPKSVTAIRSGPKSR